MSRKPKFRQQGLSLVVALIGLLAMTVAGLALMRSVQTSNRIAGNYAFHVASVHAADKGTEAALSALTTIASTSLEAAYPASCSTNCVYFPVIQTVDSNGIPSGINWSALTAQTVNTDFSVRYVIERMCSGSLPITNVPASCFTQAIGTGGSQKSGGLSFSTAGTLYFRVTVRVDGPRNTVAYTQAILAH